jgi:mono/diheme cytochrome c family protein
MRGEFCRGSQVLVLALGLGLNACETAGAPAPVTVPVSAVDAATPQIDTCGATCPPSDTNTATLRAEQPPPPISGGTLLVTRDQKLVVASDPDRDQIYFIDAVAHKFSHARALRSGDEPGRVVEDASGRIHVVLRAGHAIASLDRDPEGAIERREVCELPRGLAFDAAHDALQVACSEGKLVTLPAAQGGAITRTLEIDRDARDVIVRDGQLWVTRFRAAELMQVDSDGHVGARQKPPAFIRQEPVSTTSLTVALVDVESTATTAWRAIDVPGKGTALLHQRAHVSEVSVARGGYDSRGADCGGVVETSVTVGLDGERVASADLFATGLTVDLAADPTGSLLAVASPGTWRQGRSRQLQLFPLTGSSQLNPFAEPALQPITPSTAPDGGALRPKPPCLISTYVMPELEGQVTAISFVSDHELAVQEREPAAISFIDLRTTKLTARLTLDQPSRFDTGHALFHQDTPSGLACASCHAEAGDDSHVWMLNGIGPRRTQSLRGGLLGTEPLHWDGDMRDFPMLVDEVLVGRMSSSFKPTPEQADALAHWIDRQPALAAKAHDPAAAERGRQLFQSEAVGCATCHAGSQLTNNRFADVGTGAMFQVPSLRGVSFRLPLMHDGCVSTLRERFENACAGGDKHGHTAQLAAPQIDDLIAYVETL